MKTITTHWVMKQMGQKLLDEDYEPPADPDDVAILALLDQVQAEINQKDDEIERLTKRLRYFVDQGEEW